MQIVQVDGHSMFPTFRDGDILCVDPDAYLTTPPQIGDIVLADHPFIKDCTVIKRIHAIQAGNLFVLHGDSAVDSSDSRSFGPVALQCIRGKVVGRHNER